MKTSSSPFRVKIDEKKKNIIRFTIFSKIYDAMILFKPASIKDYKDSHQFSFKIQEITWQTGFKDFKYRKKDADLP